jgi:uncharacterized protein
MTIPKFLSASFLLCALGGGTWAWAAAPVVIPPLASPATGKLTPGRFVWSDLFSADPAASSAFYCGLFGWKETTLTSEEKSYRLLLAGGRAVAGIALGPKRTETQSAARWISYISVKDIHGAAAAVKSSGGTIVAGPRDVPDRGLHAIVVDPDGAPFGLITSAAGDPEDYLAEVDEWMWTSLFTHEPRKALPFYRKVAGWDEFEDYRTERDDDYLLASGGYARAAMSPLSADAKTAHWVGFVRVADVAATVAQARALGARVLVEPLTIQAGNNVAILIDPLGAVFGVAAFLEDSTTQP